MTRESIERARAEMAEIDQVRLPENAQKQRAASRKEGESELAELVTEHLRLMGRRAELRYILARAAVPPCSSGQQVGIGSKVTFRNLGTGKVLMLIVVSADGNVRKGTISIESPIGRALLDRCVGDVVEVPTVNGQEVQRLKIEAITEGES